MGKELIQINGIEARVAIVDMCVKNEYFTMGCTESYNKVLDMVEKGSGTVQDITNCIWVCTSNDHDWKDIYKNVYYTLIKEG